MSSIFDILFSKHYIPSRETSNNYPSGYETHAASSILNWLEEEHNHYSHQSLLSDLDLWPN